MEKDIIAYCTYFNKNYLLKGLALHDSLIKHSPGVKLYILCMDDYTKNFLDKKKLEGVTTIALNDFEDAELKKAKSNRSVVEYYWTCTPSLPRYVLKKHPSLKHIAYVDADLYFFNNPAPIFKELKNGSIYIVEHRYPKNQECRNDISGRFNVGMIVFKNNKEGRACIEKWREQCNEWCYLKEEPGRFGDQLYLNEWPHTYKNVVISKNLGVNAAPWNIEKYKVTNSKGIIKINNDNLIFYHFHQFSWSDNGKYSYASGYKFSKEVENLIYKPYVEKMSNLWKVIKDYDPNFSEDKTVEKPYSLIKNLVSKYAGNAYWKLRKTFTHDK